MTFFSRLVTPKPKLPSEVADGIGELERIAESQPSLAQHAQTMAEVLPVLFGEPEPAALCALSAERIGAKWNDGVPLLRGEDVRLDHTAFWRRWKTLCEITGQRAGKERTRPIAQAVQKSELQPQEMFAWLLAGQVATLHERSAALGLDVALTATILRWSLFPRLKQIQEQLTPSLPTVRWPHGYCPICGAWPALGEFRGLEQVRVLRCGLCAAAWEFPRLRCPFCGNDDHRRLGYFHRDGEEGRARIATCDACRGYVKTVSALTPLSPAQLLVMEVNQLPLDLIAAKRGYIAP